MGTLIHLCVNYIMSLNHQKIGEGEGLTLIVVLILSFLAFPNTSPRLHNVCVCVCVCVRVCLCPTLCNHMDWSLPDSSVPGILQARILWVAISSSRESSQPRAQTHISCISCPAGRLFTAVPPAELQTPYLIIIKVKKQTYVIHSNLYVNP